MIYLASLILALAAPFQAADETAAEDAIEAFKTAYKSTSEAERTEAVTELGKTQHPKVMARLAFLVGADGPTIRIAAAKALGAYSDQKNKAAGSLLAGLGPNAKSPTVQAAIFEALGRLGDAAALPAVHRAFDEKDTAIARAAISAAGPIHSASSVDPLIALLVKLEKAAKSNDGGTVGYTTQGGADVQVSGNDSPRKRAQDLIPVVNKTLQEITRETIGTAEGWSTWWAKNKGSFKASK